jgi:uncharacterized Zn finger protein
MSILTEHHIRQRATAHSFGRGEGYYASGAVGAPTLHDNILEAYVEGSQDEPYHVDIAFEESGGIQSVNCTCPYDAEGDCEHIVAVLLTHVRHADAPVQSPDDILADMSADQLREVIRRLRSQKPELEGWFRVMLSGMVAPSNSTPRQHVTVDTRAFRRQVQNAVDRLDYRNHWQTIWDMVNGLDETQAQASTILQQGDFNNALALMRIIGEEVAPHYGELEEEAQLAMFLEGWSEELTEAILGADLSPEQRQALSEQLDEWMVELSDYGLDETLDKPISACVRAWEDAPSKYAIDLTEARLNVIAYQGDNERYLAWCLEQDAHYRYALRLVEIGRVEDAVAHVRQHPLRVKQYEDEYLYLGRFLYEQGHTDAAFQVGMLGLENQDVPGAALARWLAKLAEETRRTEAAFRAWQIAFERSPSLDIYKSLKGLAAEDQWASLRPQLIAKVEATPFNDVLIEILIEEQRIDRAIEVWENAGYGGYELREKVVNAAAATHPDWAVEQALIEARYLIGKGSKYYPKAMNWLSKIKQIYRQHDREADWEQCAANIRAEHGRKYSLMNRLEQL